MRARDQERAFVEKLKSSPDFVLWFMNKTKFKGVDAILRLVRSDNPWYRSLKTGKDSETDILAVFENKDNALRFAFHIENKRLSDRFRPNQPELYHERATDWLNVPKWGSYQDFEVLLTAPLEFYNRNREKSDIFHHYIPHEEIAAFIPEFLVSNGG